MIKRNRFLIVLTAVAWLFILPPNAFAYLDPGTASYIFQVSIAAIIGGLYLVKTRWQRIKDFFNKHFSKNVNEIEKH